MPLKIVKTEKFCVWKDDGECEHEPMNKYVWMSTRVSSATENARIIDFTSKSFLYAIEPDVAKWRLKRSSILEKDDVRAISSSLTSEAFLNLTKEVDFNFDTASFKLREAFKDVLGIEHGIDLSSLHFLSPFDPHNPVEKFNLLKNFTISENMNPFHRIFDELILKVIAPHISETMPAENILYYQSFPCIRLVRPSEFSIGVHSDVFYGFSQGNINFYLPLTTIYGTNSLVLESIPGLENWHTVDAGYGTIKRFYGALCSHFTPENTTDHTRVSLDFRVVPGSCWETDHDQFTRNDGYYISCERSPDKSSSAWIHSDSCSSEELPLPDYRFGFPFSKSLRK